MEFKYLVIKCDELGDQFECDANREPLCLTNDISGYGLGYEIYEIKPDGSFEFIKDYETALEEGMSIHYWGAQEDPTDYNCKPTIIKKYKNIERSKVTKSIINNLKKEFGFTENTDRILRDIKSAGQHGEEINDKWVVFGEYMDGRYSLGF